MSDGVRITNYPSSKMMMIESREGKNNDRILISYANYRNLIDYGLKAFDQDLDFVPVDWEEKENKKSGDFFGFNLDETGGSIAVENHNSGRLKCRINGCTKPVKAIRNFKEEEMEEPTIYDDSICLNEFGFHDHHTGIWWQFKEPRISKNRFKEGR